ncbi:hypothetical protein SASPL_104975 [Salvia splendens]|uniref:2-isopropylmalate synthase n=1 Tax=Salvia splendens TaxID=180675 RepID=A0A8X9AB64_SALSN|nr:hypothetical protein SASPL_104975 [Salvia splendens]
MASSICKHAAIAPSPATFRSSKIPIVPVYLTRNGYCRPSTACCSLRRPHYIPNHIPDPNYVRIFDTTLRDGEQSPGATMTTKEKLDIALQLARLGVDIIEAGFPASSDADFEAVHLTAREFSSADSRPVPVICGLARAPANKISCVRHCERSWEAVKHASKPRIHTSIATSQIHMDFKLKMTPDQVVHKAATMVAYARSLDCRDVEFSPGDAGRSDREFLYRILGEVIKAGETTFNIPDTNDLGLSTANTIAGAYSGATQVEVTINGIGERAGNASLEEVEEYSGLRIQPHKANVGANAFAHENGIHQVGV